MQCFTCQRRADSACNCQMIPYCPEHLIPHLTLVGMHSCVDKFIESSYVRVDAGLLSEEERKTREEEFPRMQGRVKGSNDWLLPQKIQFVQSLQIEHYQQKFGRDVEGGTVVHEIKFSNNGQFAFVCNVYEGIIK